MDRRLFLLGAAAAGLGRLSAAETFTSTRAKSAGKLTADPQDSFWRSAPKTIANRNMAGEVIPGHDTEIRSRWTQEHLCLLYTCHYETQHLKPNPVTDKETNKLWEWDVAECFIGSDFENIHLYKEFQVSPQGEYVDLDINSRQMGQGNAVAWDSGFLTKARRDDANKVWYGEMRLPFKAIDGKEPAVGRQYRLNFLRCQGTPPNRKLINWQPTKTKTFHTPEAFGLLKLV